MVSGAALSHGSPWPNPPAGPSLMPGCRGAPRGGGPPPAQPGRDHPVHDSRFLNAVRLSLRGDLRHRLRVPVLGIGVELLAIGWPVVPGGDLIADPGPVLVIGPVRGDHGLAPVTVIGGAGRGLRWFAVHGAPPSGAGLL